MAILSKVTNGEGGWEMVILLPVDPFGQFWYLYDLFFMTLFFYILNKVLKNKNLVLLTSIILFLFTPLMNSWEFSRIFHHFVFLIMGSQFFEYQEWFEKNKFWLISGLTILSVIVYYWKIELLSFFIFGVLGTTWIVAISIFLKNDKIFELLGKKSLAIYLFHILAIAGSRIILTRFLGFEIIPILIIVLSIIGIIFPLIVDYSVTKTKLTKYIYGK